MSDIVERLRELSRRGYWPLIGDEAADEIERLNAELDNHDLLVEKLERQDAEIERLRAENFVLAAGQCVNAVGDEGGTPVCKEIERLRAELAAARAESALQPNYSCEHDGCAMREDSGYQEQARKYVDEYYKMKTELATAKALLRELVILEADGKHADESSIEVWERIRAALGDEPADDATRKQP